VFAVRLTETLPYSVYDISEALRSFGWLVPAYTLPPVLDDVAVLRVVVRNGFSRDLAKMLLDNLETVLSRLATSAGPTEARRRTRRAFTTEPGVLVALAHPPVENTPRYHRDKA